MIYLQVNDKDVPSDFMLYFFRLHYRWFSSSHGTSSHWCVLFLFQPKPVPVLAPIQKV